MQKLTIVNNTVGRSMVLDYSASPYLLQNLVGISDAPVSLLSTKGYRQDGTTAAGEYYDARIVTFSVVIFGDNVQDVFDSRRALIRHMNPKHDLTVTYENDYISKKFDCRVSGPPKFGSTQEGQGRSEQVCVISLWADDPFLRDLAETYKWLAVVEGGFEFDLEFAPDIEFGILSNGQTILTNDGDVDTPVEIRFYGPSVNPIITNENTGEYIKVLTTLLTDEYLKITTGYGNKKVIFVDDEGTETNAFDLIDESSIFWSLELGDNLISFDADSGSDQATVLIAFTNLYLGV